MHQNTVVPGGYRYSREAIKVKVKKCEGVHQPEYRKFSVDPQITSFEVLQSILAKAFDIKGEFSVCYKTFDDYGQETYLSLLSDWDLDAAFLSASEPCLSLQVDLKPFEESSEDWDLLGSIDLPRTQVVSTASVATENNKQSHARLPGLIYNQMERMFQRALNLVDGDQSTPNTISQTNTPIVLTYPNPPLAAAILVQEPSFSPRLPLTDAEFRQFLDPIGQVTDLQELRNVIYQSGIEASLRKVVWKHILNVYPEGMSGKERMDYMKRKTYEYQSLRDTWKEMVKNGQMVGELAYVTNMVRKDVLRTDRHHKFYAGNDDNQNIAQLFNILTTYAINHPSVSYCQGMSDLASPLLVTMADEAHAYICFCALMRRLKPNFLLDGIMMTFRFQHLGEALLYYDPELYAYLKSHQADDLLFCYRWLLLEMKREFAFDDALLMLEVLWSSLPLPQPPEPLPLLSQGGLPLYETRFGGETNSIASTVTSATQSPTLSSTPPSKLNTPIRENAYAKVCALRRQSSGSWSTGTNRRLQHSSLDESLLKCSPAHKVKPFSSLDEGDHGIRSGNRVVRNLNEFKNFAPNSSLKEETVKKSPPPRPPPPKIASFNREDSSPDDPAEYFPMTTSMTRELRLDLENLDRQVFGASNNNTGVGDHIIGSGGIFLWENPLRETSPLTPDELASTLNTEDGGEIFEPDETADGRGVKSVTPIRVVRNSTSTIISTSMSTTLTTSFSIIKNDSIASSPPPPRTPSPSLNTLSPNLSLIATPSASITSAGGPLPLPPPKEFGGGNPFLMFLCLTVLLQHREVVMRGRLDYNEMAMHFDKMVRQHDVHRVLRQARAMYASYLRHFDDGLSPTLGIPSSSSNRNPSV